MKSIKEQFGLPKFSGNQGNKWEEIDKQAYGGQWVEGRIDSMPHIAEDSHDILGLDFNVTKRSEELIGEKNTFLRDIESKLKKVMNEQFILNSLADDEFDRTDEVFEKNINRNRHLIRNMQQKKAI